MSKKLTVKEMKRDEVAQGIARTWQRFAAFAQQHARSLVIGVVAVVVLALAWGAIASWMTERRMDAQAALGRALESMEDAEQAARQQGEKPPDWSAVAEELRAVADEHGGAARRVALHHLGVAQLRAGDAEAALETLEEVAQEREDGWLTPRTLMVLAAAREETGDVEGAVSALERVSGRDWDAFPRDAAAMALAELHERHGRAAEAREILTSLAETEGEERSLYANRAQAKLDELEG